MGLLTSSSSAKSRKCVPGKQSGNAKRARVGRPQSLTLIPPPPALHAAGAKAASSPAGWLGLCLWNVSGTQACVTCRRPLWAGRQAGRRAVPAQCPTIASPCLAAAASSAAGPCAATPCQPIDACTPLPGYRVHQCTVDERMRAPTKAEDGQQRPAGTCPARFNTCCQEQARLCCPHELPANRALPATLPWLRQAGATAQAQPPTADMQAG